MATIFLPALRKLDMVGREVDEGCEGRWTREDGVSSRFGAFGRASRFGRSQQFSFLFNLNDYMQGFGSVVEDDLVKSVRWDG